MYCTKCGKEVEEGEKFCPNCGEKAEATVDFDTIKNFANEKVQETTKGLQEMAQNYTDKRKEEQDERKIKDISDIFIQKNEEKIAVIGGGYLTNLLHNGSLSKGFGVLTNRRFYFNGKCFYKAGKQYMKTDEERIVDLQDITATGFVHHKYLSLLLLFLAGVAFTAFALVSSLVDEYSEAAPIFFLSAIVTVFLFFIYKFFQSTFYEVSFAGGIIAVKASAYGIKELKQFNKELRLAKDKLLGER